jgi:agmatinase
MASGALIPPSPLESYMQNPSRHSPPRVQLIGLPHDANSSFLRGAAGGPAAIRRALFSDSANPFTETGYDLFAGGCLSDAGDVGFDGKDDFGVIAAAAASAANGALPIFLGGDHFVTWPVIRGMAAAHTGLTILHFDAHPDTYDELNGSRTSHACPFARIMEERLAARLVSVGIRAMTTHQRDQAARFGIEVHEMKDFSGTLKLVPAGPLYISFDLDALDPAFAPGVSHPEGGGLTTRQALSIIHGLGCPIVGADVVEMNPVRDPLQITAYAAAKVVKEIAGMMIKNDPDS